MKQVDLSAYRNTHYKPGPLLKRLLWYMAGGIFVKSGLIPLSRPKVLLLRIFGARIGRCVVLKPFVQIKYPWMLEIGDHVWIGEKVWIDNLAPVRIESHVCISQGAVLLTGNHNYKLRTFDLITDGITLHTGAWVGAGALVLPGTVFESHAVATAGAVCSGVLEGYTIYQGNPAVAVRKRTIE